VVVAFDDNGAHACACCPLRCLDGIEPPGKK
jgi:hypothetical protein